MEADAAATTATTTVPCVIERSAKEPKQTNDQGRYLCAYGGWFFFLHRVWDSFFLFDREWKTVALILIYLKFQHNV